MISRGQYVPGWEILGWPYVGNSQYTIHVTYTHLLRVVQISQKVFLMFYILYCNIDLFVG